ncbi:hypothetical protein Bbelb_137840 [Branchiostoma belcheri]|nr:hypothetical protein Bbelb_137840 [Branchiostoma belcheri]
MDKHKPRAHLSGRAGPETRRVESKLYTARTTAHGIKDGVAFKGPRQKFGGEVRTLAARSGEGLCGPSQGKMCRVICLIVKGLHTKHRPVARRDTHKGATEKPPLKTSGRESRDISHHSVVRLASLALPGNGSAEFA